MGIPNSPDNPPSLLGQAILDAIRQAVKEAMQGNGNGHTAELLTPDELARKKIN
jgi:hypothetical protein